MGNLDTDSLRNLLNVLQLEVLFHVSPTGLILTGVLQCNSHLNHLKLVSDSTRLPLLRHYPRFGRPQATLPCEQLAINPDKMREREEREERERDTERSVITYLTNNFILVAYCDEHFIGRSSNRPVT